MIRALVNYMQNDASIEALVAARIYPLVVPTDSDFPALTYQKIASVHLPTLNDVIGLTRTRVQIDAWGKTYADATNLRKTVIQSLSGQNIEYDGTCIQNILPLSDMDLFDHEALLYQARTEFYIFH